MGDAPSVEVVPRAQMDRRTAAAGVLGVCVGAGGLALHRYLRTRRAERLEAVARGIVGAAYTAVAKGTATCCVTPAGKDSRVDMGYTDADRALGAQSGSDLGLGCGNPVALAKLEEGETVVDLGCGAGIDCILAVARVGDRGSAIGVDMVPEMLARAKMAAAKVGAVGQTDFRLGEIENLPVADGVADAVISNCVLNLSADKLRVLRECYRVLRGGGRLAFSDVVETAPLPERLKSEAALAC